MPDTLVFTCKPRALGIKCAKDTGTVITEVVAGSLGQQLGLKVGMKVLKVGATDVKTCADVTLGLARAKKAMQKYTVEVELPETKLAPGGEADMGTAASTKEATARGHRVTTIVSGTNATAAAPTEPPDAEAAAEAAKAKAEAEAEAKAKAAELARRQNGKVTIKYETYDNEFEIVGGALTAAAIDAEYCLSYVMPKCRIHLSKLDGATLTARSIEDDNVKERWKYYLKEEAIAMPAPNEDGETPAIAANVRFHGLLDGDTYHVYITEDSEEEAKMMARAKVIWARADKGVEMSGNAAEARQEGCSCIEGNPCVNEYICLDWHNRFAVAAKHGWKGPGAAGAAQTAELKAMSAQELREGGSRYKRLLEERDLAACGYS